MDPHPVPLLENEDTLFRGTLSRIPTPPQCPAPRLPPHYRYHECINCRQPSPTMLDRTTQTSTRPPQSRCSFARARKARQHRQLRYVERRSSHLRELCRLLRRQNFVHFFVPLGI